LGVWMSIYIKYDHKRVQRARHIPKISTKEWDIPVTSTIEKL